MITSTLTSELSFGNKKKLQRGLTVLQGTGIGMPFVQAWVWINNEINNMRF